MLVLAVIAFVFRPSGDEDGEPSRADAGAGETEAPPSVPPEEPEDVETEEPEDEDEDSEEDDEEEGDGADEDADAESDEDGDGEGAADIPAPERPEDPCRPEEVVVTFDLDDSDKETYGSGSAPDFTVTVVNTGEQACTVDVGPEALEMVLRSGSDRIFSTADCQDGDSTEERQLSRGVPHEYSIDWERERSFADCRDAPQAAKPGWYSAELEGIYSGGTEELSFRLTG